MKRVIVLAVLAAAAALSMAAGSQQPAQGLPAASLAATKVEKVKDNLYRITGADPTNRDSFSGGNTGVFITDNGVVVVDTKLSPKYPGYKNERYKAAIQVIYNELKGSSK